MSVNLQKGQKISLVKEGDTLRRLMVGLGWDEARPKGGLLQALFGGKTQDIDCDASVLLLGSNHRLAGDIRYSLVYYGNLRHVTGAVVHQGDNLTGAGEGDDEQIMIDLGRLPADIQSLVFVVNIYDADVRRQHFGMIENAFIRVVDLDKGRELCRYNLSDNYDGMTGMVVAEIERSGREWRFSAIGQPVARASRVDALVKMYT